jgi:tetratricopeptide (TPR) repeat protein
MPAENPYALIGIGYLDVYMGNNDRGNRIMASGLENIEEKDHEILHELSVQNTKNGNYAIAIKYLNEASEINPEVYGYYGWVMLYYYRDYKRALEYLTIYDSLTPNFSDFPVGESLFVLKGLCYLMQSENEKAIDEISKYVQETTKTIGKEWVEVSTFYYLGIALSKAGKEKEAIKNFDLAIKYNPNFLEAYFERGKSLVKLGKKKMGSIDILKSKELYLKGYRKTDVYVEIFHPVYLQDIEKELTKFK